MMFLGKEVAVWFCADPAWHTIPLPALTTPRGKCYEFFIFSYEVKKIIFFQYV